MTQYERELSNLSYTNKDFGTIYPELLDLARKISYKWDPTTSDESDPGVVLLKLAALMADKNNYNIDKNILELFPLSVTQDTNARQLFDQCGYTMRYYRAATVDVSFTMVTEPELSEADLSELNPSNSSLTEEELKEPIYVRNYVIPAFTMVSDIDNSIIYTITKDVIVQSNGITTDNVEAIQGVAITYTINGEPLITPEHLDYNNRLYFTETDIAENGIFISNSLFGHSEWKRVDNLIVQKLGTPCYKFGVTEDGSTCYIEFPSDIDNIIGEGLNITYIRTAGVEGNINRRKLQQFYVDTTATRYMGSDITHTQNVIITAEHIHISNALPSDNGKNPETIDEAYRNYQKVKNTFNTLVSLPDYNDFIYTNENVSNGFVCDRTNDIQSSYKVLESDGNYSKTHTIITGEDTNNPEMTAFDLRVYGLTYTSNPNTLAGFGKSFTVIMDDDSTITSPYHQLMDNDEFNELKCIQHNFKSYEINRILMLKNKFPIITRIIPQYKLDQKQREEVETRVRNALYSTLNSRVIKFGEEAFYDGIYDTIMEADPRIKAVVLDDIEYQTYAVYSDGSKIKELRIDRNSSKPSQQDDPNNLWDSFRTEIYAKSVLAGHTQLLPNDNQFTHSLGQYNGQVKNDIYRADTNTNIDLSFVEAGAFSSETVTIMGTEHTYFYQDYVAQSKPLDANENIVFIAPNLITDKEYASYVKFIYKLNTDVSKNAEHSLVDDEFIIFFWKTEDDAKAPYEYYKYSAKSDVNLFSTTFYLNQKQPNPVNLPQIDQVLTKLATIPDGRGNTDNIYSQGDIYSEELDPITKVTTRTYYSMTEYITKLYGNDYVLSGTTSITTKKPNTIQIVNDNTSIKNVAWILNNPRTTADDQAILFNEGESKYILNTGEFLLYTNNAKTQLIMLGSGTQIERTGDLSESWSMAKIDYNDLISEGPTNYLEDLWFTVPVNKNGLIATEMQFYQLGPGNSVKLYITEQAEGTQPTTPSNIIFNNQPQDLSKYVIAYIDEQGVETILPERVSSSPNYQLGWKGYSLLNLNCSSNKAQSIYNHQTINFKDQDNNVILTIHPTEENEIYSLLTDRAISLTGGTDIDVTLVDLKGKVIPLAAYAFKLNQSASDTVKYYLNETVLSLTSSGQQIFNFNLPAGDYIIPISNESSFKSLKFTLNGEVIECINKTDLGHVLTSAGKHYLKCTINDTNESDVILPACILQIDYELATSNEANETLGNTLVIEAPYKYILDINDEVTLKEEELYKIITKVSKLDLYNQFNYIYQVPEEDLIDDPLNAQKFIEANHIYNQFTICQWAYDSDNTHIIIVNKIK